MHVSHPDKMINNSSYIICQNLSMSLARCTFQLEVREVELSEESEEKEREVAAQRRVYSSE